MKYGHGRRLNACVLWIERTVSAVLWGVRHPAHDEEEAAAAVHRVLASAQKVHVRLEEMPDSVTQKVRRSQVPLLGAKRGGMAEWADGGG